ncbi:MAG: hypothetical protein ACM31L_08520 [Actinomycetota bacterium]
MSTFLHENIHWWQHIGSTTGLMLSLANPLRGHANLGHLREFLQTVGPIKPIKRYAEKYHGGAMHQSNIIVNNYYDIDFFSRIIFSPDALKQASTSAYFESVGHAFFITYASAIAALGTTFDKDFANFPHPGELEKQYLALRDAKHEGFFYKSPIGVPPIGILHLFEGQARFSQLQYLFNWSGGSLSWEEVRQRGMLSSPYGDAFNWFLKLTGSKWPPSIDHPLINAFLLACDIAINPSEGYPFPVHCPETFISDNDPGTRFVTICWILKNKCPHALSYIRACSRNEYTAVSKEICSHMVTHSPDSISRKIVEWAANQEPLITLMKEEEAFRFSPENFPLRLLFAKHIAFLRDKQKRPEFFCWPGAWLAGELISTDEEALFNRHQAMFIDKQDSRTIVPILFAGKENDNIYDTFNTFYFANILYDQMRQWITEEGPFTYDYKWLTEDEELSEMERFAGKQFEDEFGVHPKTFRGVD